MRNLKRALSLALAAVMVLGLMIVGAGAASTYDNFTDKDEIVNQEAVNTMVSLGVLAGKEDGSYFDPTGIVTRGEMAKIIAVCLNGGKEPVLGNSTNLPKFSDVPSTHWAYNYVAYCVQQGIIAGRGDGTFAPDEPVTGSAAAKMFLCALGYRADLEGLVGSEWEINTNILANQDAKLYDGLSSINPSQGLSRDNTAQMAYNAVQAPEVKYENLEGDYSNVLQVVEKGTTMLASRFNVEKVEGVVLANDVFGILGRSACVSGKSYVSVDKDGAGVSGAYPVAMDNDLVGQRVVIYVRYNNKLSPNAAESTVLSEPIVSNKTTVVDTSARLKDSDAVKDALKGSGLSLPTQTEEVLFDYNSKSTHTYDSTTDSWKGTATDGIQAAPGVRQRFIDNDGDGTVDLIIQEKSALSKITVYNEKDEKLTLSGIGSVDFADVANYEDVAKDQYVLVTKYDDTYYLTEAETVEGEVSAYNAGTPATITIDDVDYAVSANTDKTVDLDKGDFGGTMKNMVGDTYRLYLDAAGNAISAEVIDEALGNYAIITATDATAKEGFSTGKVKLTMSDGTSGTYDVDLLASAKRWDDDTDKSSLSDAGKEAAMATELDGIKAPTLTTYSFNDDGSVVLGKPQHINPSDYAETGSKTVDNGASSSTTSLYSSDSSYKIGSVDLVMDNTTVFFIEDDNGINVVVGLNSLPSKGVTSEDGKANAIYEIKTSINTNVKTNVATAVYLKVDGTYASSANYIYITSDYSSIKENGDTIYRYDVVFTDGTTGTVKTKDTVALAKNQVYSYTLDSKGYADIKADDFTVNNVYVDDTGDNTVILLNADNYSESMGSYPLASDVQIWNVEDTDDIYPTSLGKTSVAALVLNDDKEIKYAFVNEVRGDEMTEVLTGTGLTATGGTMTGIDANGGEQTWTGAIGSTGKLSLALTVGDEQTATVKVSKDSNATGTIANGYDGAGKKLAKGDDIAVTDLYTAGAAEKGGKVTITVTVSEKDKIDRVITYVVTVENFAPAYDANNLTVAGGSTTGASVSGSVKDGDLAIDASSNKNIKVTYGAAGAGVTTKVSIEQEGATKVEASGSDNSATVADNFTIVSENKPITITVTIMKSGCADTVEVVTIPASAISFT